MTEKPRCGKCDKESWAVADGVCNTCWGSEFHGWKTEHGTLHIGHLPERKSVCLYLIQGSVMYTCAYFRNEEEALRVVEFLDKVML